MPPPSSLDHTFLVLFKTETGIVADALDSTLIQTILNGTRSGMRFLLVKKTLSWVCHSYAHLRISHDTVETF